MFSKFQKIHFVGIGGVGMSGIAEVLLNLGYQVSGSDAKRGSLASRLKRKGATVFFSHRAEHVGEAHVVVVSSAVSADNPEVAYAESHGIPVIRRAEMLAELMRLKYGICVAGSHGKTTTTSLVATILYKAGLDPTMVIGGKVESFRSNARLGKGDFFVAESDESDGSFLRMVPTVAVVTNIDPEHLDYYESFGRLQAAFSTFMSRIPFYGTVVGCHDHPIVRQLLRDCDRPHTSYGLTDEATIWASNIEQSGLASTFTIHREKEALGRVHVRLAGNHNVLNVLAATAVALHVDIPFKKIAKGLESFKGIDRRCQVYLEKPTIVIDDYAHHPEEIKATIRAVKTAYPNHPLTVCFQPHRYSRTAHLFHELSESFREVDQLFLSEIYAASEKNTYGVSGKDLYDTVKLKKTAHFIPNILKEWKKITDNSRAGDVILVLGAGNIGQLPRLLAKHLRKCG